MVLISQLLSAVLLGASFVVAAPATKTPKATPTPAPRPVTPPAAPAIPAGSVIIGYRTVGKTEADGWNKDSSIHFLGNRIGTQIGDGIYLTPKRRQWAGQATDWTCIAYADKTKLDAVAKEWIPRQAGVVPNIKTLWFNNKNTEQYIKDLGNPVNSIRLALFSGSEPETQMALPKGLLGKSGPLAITAYCREPGKEGNMPSTVVDYSTWKNVKGAKNVL
ncbi:hypothetical protein BGZ60DRAFT_565457 [Tricladium varicosporioides]|nr:hypothetical protein BGZ60DRAFT_565457 [Hymenoscyphus varicosporioides]